MKQVYRLSEIDIMRPTIIILLVLMHSFVIFSPTASTWPLPAGIYEVKLYHWIQELSYSFLLESFTFISGYVYAYAVLYRNKNYSFISLAYNKFKRLIIPSVIFSLLYTPLFYEGNVNCSHFIYDIICGIGHMWYLPMLFMCFLVTWIIQRVRINELLKLVLLLLLAVISIRLPSVFRMNTVCYYLFFFYLGYNMYKRRKRPTINIKMYYWGGYLLVITPLIVLRQELVSYAFEASSWMALIAKLFSRVIVLSYSLMGTILLYHSCLHYSRTNGVSSFVVCFNKYCMGIYLVHQFVLRYLYYYTNMPCIGTYCLPFISFLFTLTISYVFVKYACCTKVGYILFR